MSLLEDSENLRMSIIDGLTDLIPGLEDKIQKRILQLFDQYNTKGGYFVRESASYAKMLAIQTEIEDILKKAGYYKAANTYIQDLAKITQNTLDLQKDINSLDIERRSLSGIEKIHIERSKDNLIRGGLRTNFIQPVTDAMNKAVTFGYSIEKTRENLEILIKGDLGPDGKPKTLGKLKQYLTVTARDTVKNLQGDQQNAIRAEYKMPLIRYVGGLLKDSRGQCVRWVNKGYIEYEQLDAEIKLVLERQKMKAKEGKGHPYSGFIKTTTPESFLQDLGGWGCLHMGVPVRKRA